jgi:phosphatidylglycerophosphate synthase
VRNLRREKVELKLSPGHITKSRVLNIPNILSFLRLLALPFVLYALHRREMLAIFSLLGFIVATDILDGYLARKWNIVSSLGKILDHVVDKLVLLSVTLILTIDWKLPHWFFYFLFTREILTLILGFYLWRYWGIVGQSNILGRIAGLSLCAAYISYILEFDFKLSLVYVAFFFLVLASLNYFRLYAPILFKREVRR